MVGKEEGEIIAGARRAAREHSLPFESLTTPEIRSRFPMLKVLDEEMGVYEPDGGVLDPERAICAHLDVAKAAGAQMRFEVAMESWEPTADGFTVHLADGTTFATRALVLSLGAWFKDALECSASQFASRGMSRPGLSPPRTSMSRPISRRFSSTGKVCPHRSMAFLISATA